MNQSRTSCDRLRFGQHIDVRTASCRARVGVGRVLGARARVLQVGTEGLLVPVLREEPVPVLEIVHVLLPRYLTTHSGCLRSRASFAPRCS